jgi:hypothetical protein
MNENEAIRKSTKKLKITNCTDSKTVGRGFEPCCPCHLNQQLSQMLSLPDWTLSACRGQIGDILRMVSAAPALKQHYQGKAVSLEFNGKFH